jgi:vancomycin resistance protein VanJ
MARLIATVGLGALIALVAYALLLLGLAFRPRLLSPRIWSRIAGVLHWAALLGVVAVVVALVGSALLPQRAGPLALLQVLAPYLVLPALLVVPLAFILPSRSLGLVLGLCLAVALLRTPPSLGGLTAPRAAEAQLTIFHWNATNDGPERQQRRLRPILAARPADIVVLPETYWGWLREDPAITRHYPYQMVHTEQATSGLVLLSAFPFLEADVARNPPGVRGWPRLVWARLDLWGDETMLVVAAHPESPYSSNSDCRFFVCYDTAERDSLTPRIREVIDPALARGERVLLVGDLNTTDREPGYAVLAAGLRDVHRAVGLGWGHSWGIHSEPWSSDAPIESGVLPLLRIDYMFASPNLLPLTTRTDCHVPGSDHCALWSAFAVVDA